MSEIELGRRVHVRRVSSTPCSSAWLQVVVLAAAIFSSAILRDGGWSVVAIARIGGGYSVVALARIGIRVTYEYLVAII